MDLRQLATFRMVAVTLNFTQAAAALGYVQSSVTAQIQSLENDLGVALFERLGKRVALTDAGERLLKYAEQLLILAEEARVAVAGDGNPMGTLNISAPESVCTYRLPAILQHFRQQYPQVRVVFRPTKVSELRRRVQDGELDLAFALQENTGDFGGLTVETLLPEPLVVLAPANHPLNDKPAVYAADLIGEAVLLTELGCSYRNLFEHVLIAAGVYPSSALEFNSIEAIKQCVIAGMGITTLPAMAVQRELSEGQLLALKWAGQPMKIDLQMIWHKDKWMSPALTAFMKTVHEVIAPQPASP